MDPKRARKCASARKNSQSSELRTRPLDSEALSTLAFLANAPSSYGTPKQPRERSTNILTTTQAVAIKPGRAGAGPSNGSSINEVPPLDDVSAAIILSCMRGLTSRGRRDELYDKRMSQNYTYRDRLVQNGIYPIKVARHRYICSRCLASFPKEVLAWRHGANHLNTKPFECKICGKDFNRYDSLQRHIRKMHNDASNAYFTEDT